jgi:hypothetical protein
VTLKKKAKTFVRQKQEIEREYARSLTAHVEALRQLEERSENVEGQCASLEKQRAEIGEKCAVQRIELEWLYRWIPVNKVAREFLFGGNLRQRLTARLHLKSRS